MKNQTALFPQTKPITLAEEDRPIYRATTHGIASCSDSEVLSLILSGSPEKGITAARTLLQYCDNDLHTLSKKDWREIAAIPNIGKTKAIAITATMELSRRRFARDIAKRPDIRTSSDAYAYLMPQLVDKNHEEFWVILLNQSCRVLACQIASTGGVAHVPVDIKVILKNAVMAGSTQIILAHNHPSGRLDASQSDIALTERLATAAKLMDIRVIDHLIIGDGGYFSFADEGML